MSHRRRAALLIGLALLLGVLATSSVARREAALNDSLGPSAPVLVARTELAAGRRIAPADLALREIPARYLPPGALGDAQSALGREPAHSLPTGSYLTEAQLARPGAPPPLPGPRLGRGERVAQVVAVAPPQLLEPGTRVDVLVTRERGEGDGTTELALQDVELLAASEIAGPQEGATRVAAELRVGLADAIRLAEAQAFAAELRLLPRAPGDRRRASGAAR